MKKIRRFLSVLIAVIFVVGCFSMSAGAESAFAQGFYEGSCRYHATNEAYYEFFCATFECRVKCSKKIKSNLNELYCDGTMDVWETSVWCDKTEIFLYDIVIPDYGYYCKGHAGSEYQINDITIDMLVCNFDEAFIPEESDD